MLTDRALRFRSEVSTFIILVKKNSSGSLVRKLKMIHVLHAVWGLSQL